MAWLVVRRLDTVLQATPLLGLVAAWCATPLILLALVCAHADGRVAAYDRHAVIWIRPLTAAGRGVHTRREHLTSTVVLLPWLTVLLFAAALGTADQTSTLIRAVALSLASSILAGHLLAVFAVHRWRDLITRRRRGCAIVPHVRACPSCWSYVSWPTRQRSPLSFCCERYAGKPIGQAWEWWLPPAMQASSLATGPTASFPTIPTATQPVAFSTGHPDQAPTNPTRRA